MFFGKLPFCGKYAVRGCMARVMNSKNKAQRIISSAMCLSFMVLYIITHFGQVCLGCCLFYIFPSPIVAMLGVCYAIVNLGVCLEQGYLVYRIIVFTIRRRGRYRSSKYRHSLSHDNLGQYLISAMVTLTGQLLVASHLF